MEQAYDNQIHSFDDVMSDIDNILKLLVCVSSISAINYI